MVIILELMSFTIFALRRPNKHIFIAQFQQIRAFPHKHIGIVKRRQGKLTQQTRRIFKIVHFKNNRRAGEVFPLCTADKTDFTVFGEIRFRVANVFRIAFRRIFN